MTPIIIPAYEPDERLIELLASMLPAEESANEPAGTETASLQDAAHPGTAPGPVVIVDDGSGDAFREIFEKAALYVNKLGGAILTHEVNKGKGRALKTAFAYVLKTWPDAIGCVTADSDGQHTAACIASVQKALEANPDKLVLGVREFGGEDVPWKSRAGNTITVAVFDYVSGIRVTDTQTGLRGIPRAFMQELLDVRGERFEFETQMLLESAGRYPILEVPIKTIYDSRDNHQTHFNAFRDSVKIYKILGARFMKYIMASLSSCVIDLALFAIFCRLLKGKTAGYAAIATVAARLISGTFNYLMNYKVVFESDAGKRSSGARYLILAIVQMGLSAALVSGGIALLPDAPEVAVKIIVDTALFLVSYKIQQKYVFGRG